MIYSQVYVELEGRLVNQRVVSALARGKYPSAHHLHPNDNKAVVLLLEQLKKQHPSPLLAFTPQTKNDKPLFLVLQHQSQLKSFENHLNNEEVI